MSDLQNSLTPIELSDPFFKDKIVAMGVWAGYDFNGLWVASGYIMFVEKNTHGRQNFEGRSFDEVIKKMKEFLSKMR